MRLARLVIVAAVFLAAGCRSGSATSILTHVNNREFFYNRYIEECVVERVAKDCDAFRLAVDRYKKVIAEGHEAHERGGDYPLQAKEMKAQLKRTQRARGK